MLLYALLKTIWSNSTSLISVCLLHQKIWKYGGQMVAMTKLLPICSPLNLNSCLCYFSYFLFVFSGHNCHFLLSWRRNCFLVTPLIVINDGPKGLFSINVAMQLNWDCYVHGKFLWSPSQDPSLINVLFPCHLAVTW